mmetsp:Transcript_17694/g.52625  ORF Transcript_17694/g.52625 Transcript_17694/m.52625 type:complete len:221 (+) Transcript_17694:269-931(+)
MSYFGRGSLVKYLPKFAADWVHNLQFRPKMPHRMEPGPAANWRPAGVERIQGYRYPAPGSREAARVPRVENTDEVFDTKYYSRDTRRAPRDRAVILAKKYLAPGELKAIEAADAPLAEGEEPPDPTDPRINKGSRGQFGELNFKIAVSRYSPDGLRSAMSAKHDALQAAIDSQDADQLVTYAWEKDADAILADCAAKGLPPTPGAPFKWNLPASARQAQW